MKPLNLQEGKNYSIYSQYKNKTMYLKYAGKSTTMRDSYKFTYLDDTPARPLTPDHKDGFIHIPDFLFKYTRLCKIKGSPSPLLDILSTLGIHK